MGDGAQDEPGQTGEGRRFVAGDPGASRSGFAQRDERGDELRGREQDAGEDRRRRGLQASRPPPALAGRREQQARAEKQRSRTNRLL